MVRVKTNQLRGKKKEELIKDLDEQKNELASLKVTFLIIFLFALTVYVFNLTRKLLKFFFNFLK